MNLLFDLDGTLAEPFPAIKSSLLYAFKKSGLPAPDDATLRKCIGPPLQVSLVKILGASPEQALQLMADYREHHAKNCIADYAFYPGAREALESLKNNHRLFVATSKPHAFARPILKHFGFDSFFEGIYGSELDGVRSAKTELIRYVLETEQLLPEKTLMIGDREHDALGARQNAVKAFGVLWGYGSREELVAAGTTQQAKNWLELCEMIESLARVSLQ
jgi:phosphoglycolate phosphatase